MNFDINFEDLNNLKFILCGAAITIQSAWRGFRCRQNYNISKCLIQMKNSIQEQSEETMSLEYKLRDFMNDFQEIESECATKIQRAWRSYKSRKEKGLMAPNFGSEIYLDNFSKYCFTNNFLCDVIIYVQNKIYYCHSVVLWCTSRYFKKLLERYDINERLWDKKLKYQLLISTQCWEIIQSYIYGYDVVIDKDLLDELVHVANELKIEDLKRELRKLPIDSNLNTNQNCNNNSTSSFSIDSKSSSSSLIYLASQHPFQLISNYYKFFKCVINFYVEKKLSYAKTFIYLSTNYIDYSKMNEAQLRKCIYLLKTKLKLSNSSLILKIIDIYLHNKSS